MTTTTLLITLLAIMGLSLILVILFTKKGIILTGLTVILANQYIIEAIIGSRYFHDSRTLLTGLIQIQGIIPGLILIFLFISRLLNKNKKGVRLKLFEWGLLLFLIVSIFASLIGILYENSILYLVGDQFKYIYISLGYFFVAFSLKSAQDRQWLFSVIIVFGAVFSIAGLITQLANFWILGRPTISSGIEPAVLIFLFLTIIFSSKLKYSYSRSWNVMFFMTLIIISAVISRSRRDVLYIIFGFIGSVWLIPNKMKVFVNLGKYILTGLFLFLLFFVLSTPYLGEQYQTIWNVTYNRIIEKTFDSSNGLSTDGRFIEIADAIQYTAELPGNYFNFLFGLGSGAEYETSLAYSTNLTDGRIWGSKHQIHNTYFSVLFRLGVFGFLFFILFIVGILFNAYGLVHQQIKQGLFGRNATVHFVRLATLFLTILLISFIEWNIAYTLGSAHLIIMLGIIGAELRYREG